MNTKAMEQERRQYGFRNLALWQRGQELALEAIKMVERLPDTASTRVIARQVVASSSSVPANIAEGHGRFSVASYRNHLSIARGSVCETETWIDLLHRAGYIDARLEAELSRRCHDLLAGLTRQMKSLERKLAAGRTTRVREDKPVHEYLVGNLDDE